MPTFTFRVPGPVTVKYNNNPLGASKAGATIRSRTAWAPITADLYGSEPADFIFGGKAATVEFIGLDPAALKSSVSDLFTETGGLLASIAGAGSRTFEQVGRLASAMGKILNIVERDGSSTWTANIAVPLDPDPLALIASVELQQPIVFLIVPDANGLLFATIPTYVT